MPNEYECRGHIFDPDAGIHTYTVPYECNVCFESAYQRLSVHQEAHEPFLEEMRRSGWLRFYRCGHCTWKAQWDAEWAREHPEEDYLYVTYQPHPDWFIGGRSGIMASRRER